jgi:hypothetical protein
MKFFWIIIMATLVKVGSFQMTTAIAGTVQSITGVGFQPKFVKFWWNGRTNVANAVGAVSHQRGTGVAVNSSFGVSNPNYCVYTKSQAPVSPSNSSTDIFEIRCIATMTLATNTSDGEASTTAWNNDGFDLTINKQFPVGTTIFYEAFGGDDITQIETLVTTEPATAIPVNMTFGFTPDYLYQISNPTGAVTGGIADDSRMDLGSATFRDGIQQFSIAMGANDNVATMATQYFNRGDKFISHIDTAFGASLTGQASISARANNVVTLNWDIVSGGANREHIVLAVKGGQWFTSSFTLVTAPGTITVTNVPFRPKGICLYSVNRPQNASGVPGSIDEWTMGAYDGTNQRVATTESANGGATSNVVTALEFDSMYIGTNGISAIDARVTGTSLDERGFTASDSLTDVNDRIVYFDAVGDAVPPFPKRDDFTRIRM